MEKNRIFLTFGLLAVLPTGLFTSCNPGPVTLELVSNHCSITGQKTKYSYGEEVNIHIDPESKFYYRPSNENIGVYGITNFSYDEDVGDLKFRITNNVRIEANGECKYGEEVSRSEFTSLLGGDTLDGHPVVPIREFEFLNYDFWWDFSTVTNETTKEALFALLSEKGLVTDQLAGHKTYVETRVLDAPDPVKSYAYTESGFNATFLYQSQKDHYFLKKNRNIDGPRLEGNVYLKNFEFLEGHPTTSAMLTFKINNSLDTTNGAIVAYELYFENFNLSDDYINGYLKFIGGEMNA